MERKPYILVITPTTSYEALEEVLADECALVHRTPPQGLSAARELLVHLRAEEYDVVYARSLDAVGWISAACMLAGVSFVVNATGIAAKRGVRSWLYYFFAFWRASRIVVHDEDDLLSIVRRRLAHNYQTFEVPDDLNKEGVEKRLWVFMNSSVV